jgi:E3 ubiquitin-protein ligase HECTD1
MEDLCLVFARELQSVVCKQIGWPLATNAVGDQVHAFEFRPGGLQEEVTLANSEEWIKLVLDIYLESGIRSQMEAFRAGFNEVFPIEKLAVFRPAELKTITCGEMDPDWTRQDLLKYTIPVSNTGYTAESPGYQHFVDALVQFSPAERREFVMWATGSPSLPPGGIANLYPRITVSKKSDSTAYPSVNTCKKAAKIPEYDSVETLVARFKVAFTCKDFGMS